MGGSGSWLALVFKEGHSSKARESKPWQDVFNKPNPRKNDG